MRIKLPWIETSIDLYYPPENLDELVQKSFKEFTKGTSEGYQFLDKLRYIDNLRKKIHRFKNAEFEVTKIIGERASYEIFENDSDFRKDDLVSKESLISIFEEGFLPLQRNYYGSSSMSFEANKTVVRIIKSVINYE